MDRSELLHRALTSGDPNVWAAAREEVERPALANTDLNAATLADFDLSDADLSNADLSEADLTGAVLDGANLEGADLTASKLLELDVTGASFQGAALDEAQVSGLFTECNFTDSTWASAAVRGARFVRCQFEGAEIDLAQLARFNRFERCAFGDRDDVPEELGSDRPEFLRPPILEGERVRVTQLALAYRDEAELKREAIGAATGAGWEPEMIAFLRDGTRIYLGLRPEPSVDELEEWLAFEARGDEGLVAVELSIDPGFETFLEEVVVPMFEAGGGDLALTIEQDLEGGGAAVTEVAIQRGISQPARQYKK